MKKLFIALIIAAIIVTIGFVISGIANATAQESPSKAILQTWINKILL
jgi:uncharacterized alpha/beta hydrolase family protein